MITASAMKVLMVGGEFVKLQKTYSYAYFKPVAFLTTSIKSLTVHFISTIFYYIIFSNFMISYLPLGYLLSI